MIKDSGGGGGRCDRCERAEKTLIPFHLSHLFDRIFKLKKKDPELGTFLLSLLVRFTTIRQQGL